jgi:alcohol dehydrogenase/L-iditol 2-dehydrogenase
MLAARAYKDETLLRLEQIAVPEIGDTEVLVRNRSSNLNRGTIALWRSARFMPQLPSVLGYEIAGEIAAVGAAVAGYSDVTRWC